MNQEEKAKFEMMAKISKALAHPTRLYIIHKLDQQEFCVNELTQMVGSDVSTVSKHLKILREAGIIVDEKRGNCVYYTLQTRCVLNIFSCVMNVINANKTRMAQIGA